VSAGHICRPMCIHVLAALAPLSCWPGFFFGPGKLFLFCARSVWFSAGSAFCRYRSAKLGGAYGDCADVVCAWVSMFGAWVLMGRLSKAAVCRLYGLFCCFFVGGGRCGWGVCRHAERAIMNGALFVWKTTRPAPRRALSKNRLLVLAGCDGLGITRHRSQRCS